MNIYCTVSKGLLFEKLNLYSLSTSLKTDGTDRCRLLCLEWMGNGVLLYSTGNGVQSLGLGKKKKQTKKHNGCVREAGAFCYTIEIKGTLQMKYILIKKTDGTLFFLFLLKTMH